jgi:16S rRNA (cytosine1407-C5)-methyltransferase
MKLSDAFIEQTRLALGEEAESLFTALDTDAPVSVRRNPLKKPEQTENESVLWSSFGCYLPERPSFTFDPLLHAGCYYVQEASSMFVEKALNVVVEKNAGEALTMLDLCAAPGGKSTLALSVLPEGSLLVANELIRTRANILAENLMKWGQPNVVVTQSDSSCFTPLKGLFDVILTDVPCSGEGMFRKDSDSVAEWSEDNVRLCTSRQREIVSNIWPALKNGGFLIYSTCTYNLSEDEDNVQWICEELGASLMEIPLNPDWKVAGAQATFSSLENFPVYRFLPHRTKGEGFFLALIQKEDSELGERSFSRKEKSRRSGTKKPSVIPPEASRWLLQPERFDIYWDRQGHLSAFPQEYIPTLRWLEEGLRIVHAGVVIGEMKGRDLLPDISLALSLALDRSGVNECDLSLADAIDYLRREALVLPEDCPKGWVLMTYEGHPLGWMKNLGNRANNAYPNEWRIRSSNPHVRK